MPSFVLLVHMLLPPYYFVYFSQGLADNTVIAKVNGQLWDLDRPLEEDATLHLLKFDDPDGKHSSCNIYFLQCVCQLCAGQYVFWPSYVDCVMC